MSVKEKNTEVQNIFLNHLRDKKVSLIIFLTNGVKLKGNVKWFDDSSVILSFNGRSQIVYKHAIATIMPEESITWFGNYDIEDDEYEIEDEEEE